MLRNGIPVSTFLGLDLVKHLDSYMDPIQFILFGCAVGLICMYRVLYVLDSGSIFKTPVCFDPPVVIPELGLLCSDIALQNRCGELSDQSLCPFACERAGVCDFFDPIITNAQMFAQHLVPALAFLLVGVLNYANAREGVEYDKEWSNAIWFFSIWGSGITIFFGGINMVQGKTNDWNQSYLVPMNPDSWWSNIIQTMGFLKFLGGAALFFNVTFANMYAEAIEDNPTESLKELELVPGEGSGQTFHE